MSRMIHFLRARHLRRALLFGLMLVTVACDDGATTSPNPVVAQVVVAPATGALQVGDTQEYVARAFDARGREMNAGAVSWSSSRETVATVSATGTVTAVGPGDAAIRATIGGTVGTAQLEVTLAPVATVELSHAQLSLVEGQSQDLIATAKDAAGRVLSGRAVLWSASDPTVVAVTATGTVTAVSTGTARVRATIEGIFMESVVTVQLAAVDRVELSVSALTIVEHEGAELTAVVKDAAGRVLTGRTVTWTSSAPEVATIDGAGRISALSEGRTIVTARAEGAVSVADVSVTRAPVASIVIFPSAAVLEIGESVQLTSGLKDAHGHVLEGRAVQWRIEGAASMTPTGVMTGVRNGYVTVTAISEGVSASTAATVVQGELPPFDLVYHRVGAAGASELFLLPLGAGTAPLKLNAGNVSRSPTPSPNGTRVAFAVSMADPLTGARIDDIFAVDRTGLNMRQLTKAPGFDDSPDWSPSGNSIAYHHWEAEGRSDIWVMNADGSAPVNLTADMPATGIRSAPEWSRDGSRIAFSQFENGAGVTTASIWTMRADGSDKRRVTVSTTGFDSAPTWSPDGGSIAFVRYYSGEADITIVRLADGQLSRLRAAGLESAPAWSPDGGSIAFTHTGTGNIYTMQPDGSRLRLRTVDATWGGGLAPAWIARQ